MITAIITIFTSAVGALSSAVVYLWRKIESYHKATTEKLEETTTKLEECEEDRKELWKQLQGCELPDGGD